MSILCRLQNKGRYIRTYCDPQSKANYGRKLQPGSSNPNLSRACIFIHGCDTFLQSSPTPLNVMCLKQQHNSKPYQSLVDAVCEKNIIPLISPGKIVYTAWRFRDQSVDSDRVGNTGESPTQPIPRMAIPNYNVSI